MDDSIGWAYSVGPIAVIVSPFFLGIIADRFFSSERVLAVMHLIGGLAMFAAAAKGVSQSVFIICLLIHMLAYMATLRLTNTVAVHAPSNFEKQIPLIRGFWNLRWIAAELVVN